MKSCAFTGHRPQKLAFGTNENDPRCVQLKSALRHAICVLVSRGYYCFYTGCALGVDLWAGEIVEDLMKSNPDLQLHCIIPYEGQANAWPEPMRDRYFHLIANATEERILQAEYSRDCFYNRNCYMVDHANMVLAVCNSTPPITGGTGYTVRYALREHVPVLYLDPASYVLSPNISVK